MSNDKNNKMAYDHALKTPAPTPTSVKGHVPKSPAPVPTGSSQSGGSNKK